MKSKMTECYDYRLLEVPEELKKWKIPDSEISQELENLARDHSTEEIVENEIQEGDCVRCINEETKQTVLLYPGLKLPGAEQAEGDCLGKKAKDVFSTAIRGKETTLFVEKVIRRHRVEVGEELMKKLNLPGVTAVEDYYQWYHQTHDGERKQKACYGIVKFWLTEMSERSQFSVDEEEKKAWCYGKARLMYDGMQRAGYDMRKRQDGSVVTEEQAVADAAAAQEMYFIPYLMYTYFCEKDGFVITEEIYLKEVEKIANERKMKLEDALAQSTMDSFCEVKYQDHTFLKLAKEAEKYLEV